MLQIGRYRVTGELGRGAMGVVYRAEDPAIGRTVAIKTIRLNDVDDPKEREFLRQRLVREARSAGVLSHPGIVTIYDVQEHEGVGYVFMEFVDGPSLERVMREHSMEPEQVISIIEQTAAALDFAHSRGIVHRDIKPGNIMLAQGNIVKITDFGVARFTSQQATLNGVVLGTPSYMSPEQITDRPTDGRTDQFALGVMTYQLLTGEKPFIGDSLASLMFKIVNDDLVPPQRLNPTLGPAADNVLKRVLAKDPAQRFGTCAEFARALRAAAEAQPSWHAMRQGAVDQMETVAESISAIAVPIPPPRVLHIDEPEPEAAPEAAAEPRQRSGWPLVISFIGGITTIALLFVAARWLLFNNDSGSRQPVTVTAEKPVNEENKPSAMGPATAPPPQPPAAIDPGAKPPETATAVPSTSPGPAEGQDYVFHVATVPPGGRLIFDGTSNTACVAPCDVELPAGRHTLAVTLDGYRLQSRIFNLPQDKEVLIPLDRSLGTLTVRSSPSGATIVLNGQERREKTPASLTLPTGRYKLELIREGLRKQEHQIEVKDGVVANLDVTWNQSN